MPHEDCHQSQRPRPASRRIGEGLHGFPSGPGAAWSCEVIGTIRPAPLSSTNTDTYLTDYLSDLFFAACMVSATGGLLKNYGSQADSAQQAISWQAQYQERLASAKREELRKSFVSAMSSPPTSAKDA